MTTKIENITTDQFFIAGISVRTTNQNGRAMQDIGALWGRFMAEDIAINIAGKVSEDVYCVYTCYETDHTGFYTAVLGCKVNSLDVIPESFTGLTMAGGSYRVYSLNDSLPQTIGGAWMEIWNSDIARAYTADFDVYMAAEKGAKIYLSVK